MDFLTMIVDCLKDHLKQGNNLTFKLTTLPSKCYTTWFALFNTTTKTFPHFKEASRIKRIWDLQEHFSQARMADGEQKIVGSRKSKQKSWTIPLPLQSPSYITVCRKLLRKLETPLHKLLSMADRYFLKAVLIILCKCLLQVKS